MDKKSLSKPTSYYDWKLAFTPPKLKERKAKKKLNSLGIKATDFEKFLKKWKKAKLNLKLREK